MRFYKVFRNFGINLYLNVLFSWRKISGKNKVVDKSLVLKLIHDLRPINTSKALVRMGPDGDGGYVVPDDFEDINVCFSPGVGEYSGFEKDLADRGITVYMADASVEKPLIEHDKFKFERKFIGKKTEGAFISMNDWTKDEVQKNSDDMVLQMDIEGHEYDALSTMDSELISRFRVIILEMHSLYRFWEPEFYKMARDTFDKLLKDHYCVHVHPNNCCSIFHHKGVGIPRAAEFSFIRKDRVEKLDFANVFPHPLDQDNRPMPHIVLPKDWIGQ